MNKIFLILMMLILGSSLIFAGCKQQEEAATITPPITQPEAQQPAEPGTPPMPPFAGEQETPAEEIPQEQVPAEIPASDKLLSNINCVNKVMGATITNILDKQIDLSKTIVFVNGILSSVKISCDKMILEPGESASCTGLAGTISLSATKTNKIIFRVDSAQAEEFVECK